MQVSAISGYAKFLKPSFNGREAILYQNDSLVQEGDKRYMLKNLLDSPTQNRPIEKTLGAFHSVPQHKIYFADPMEYINDEMRTRYDYIIYDNEPQYPKPDEISRSYFGSSHKTYRKDFEEIRDYYYRLMEADQKTLARYENNQAGNLTVAELNEKIDYYKDRIAKSQYQQWQAAECLNRYSKADNLLNQKFNIENNIHKLQADIDTVPVVKPIHESNIEINKKLVKEQEKALHTLKEKRNNYLNIQKLNSSLSDGGVGSYKISSEEEMMVEKESLRLQYIIKETLGKISVAKQEIKNAYQYLEKLSTTLIKNPVKIKEQNKLLDEVKAKLIPLFDHLKDFYAQQRIIK